MTEYAYRALYNEPQQTAEDPHQLVRVEVESGYPEALRANGKWTISLTWMSMRRGDHMFDDHAITREQAIAIAQLWHRTGVISKIPRDLRKP